MINVKKKKHLKISYRKANCYRLNCLFQLTNSTVKYLTNGCYFVLYMKEYAFVKVKMPLKKQFHQG